MTAQIQAVKTRFTIISDTHTAKLFPSTDTEHAYREPLPSADVLLHAGDLTNVGYIHEHETTFDMVSKADAELKIVIAGNHDITLDEQYYRTTGAARMHRNIPEDTTLVKEIWTGAKAKEAAVVYLEEGVRTFTLKNGATFTIYTSPYTPEFCGWAFPYERDSDRFFNPQEGAQNPIPPHPAIDILLTHGPPLGILDETAHRENVGCEHLLRAVQRCRPRLHCFGHIHEGWGAERRNWVSGAVKKLDSGDVRRKGFAGLDLTKEGGGGEVRFGEETVFVNASVMDVGYRPVNAPWSVDLDLPVKG
ncbi:MAG: hypothetical protein LQ338_006121 [Usnochroma carphineum]|nr:MAG: hypothetical protein LQ338_006121 [Usnochroma carphineum]